DEPTNHLDIPSREVLEEALREYDGTVLLVSHDRYLVDRLCGRLLLLWPGRWELVEGNYSHWQELQQERADKTGTSEPSMPPRSKPSGKSGVKAASGSAKSAGPAKKVAGLNTYQLKKLTLRDLEDQIHQAERQLGEVEESFANPTVFSDRRKLQAAQAQYEQLRRQIDQLMELWQMKMEHHKRGR
ncbi:MAG: ABC-F family ATP-binding cassette domain-containing protein, partial [Planctomycetes bacterium]|nr:ABC-F family ATP-binding cassette domain-containing protein [Planctomycetota bacterium]